MSKRLLRGDEASLGVVVADLVEDIGELMEIGEPVDPGIAAESRRPPGGQLAALWDVVSAELLRAIGDERSSAVRLTNLTELLGRIREAENAQARLHVTERADTLMRVRAALRDIREATTVDELLTLAPQAVCSLGFDRALLSTVDHSWRLHSMCVVRDPRWAEEIVAVGRENPPELDRRIVENDTVVGAQATLVREVQDNPRVNRPLAAITKSSSYGIAPLMIDGDVVGLVHGDCYHQQRDLNEVDRGLLSTFAEGMSHSLARASVLDNLSAVTEQLKGASGWKTPARIAPSAVAARSSASDDDLLTRREVQIVRLMADGHANAKIARRLVITEGTVKTHITHVLRKLGATNRAEAVAIWLRSRADQPEVV